jgi:hypothetical protein
MKGLNVKIWLLKFKKPVLFKAMLKGPKEKMKMINPTKSPGTVIYTFLHYNKTQHIELTK